MAGAPTPAPYGRPRPAITSLNRPHWEALRRHELSLPRCRACGLTWAPPGPRCPSCWASDPEWVVLSGRGTVTSYVVFHQAAHRAFADDVPYNVAEVELAEGPRLLADVVGVAAESLRVGMEVVAVYDDVADDLTLVRFRPAA